MAESTRIVDLVTADLDRVLSEREPVLAGIAPDLAPFIDYSRDLLGGGKRVRALFCYWGRCAVLEASAQGCRGMDDPDLAAVVRAAAALEVFHAAALVHDDIMDNSDTRRGMPAAHRRFEGVHRDGGWTGAPVEFGRSAALLLGDLLLGWSDELFDDALRALASEIGRPARDEFTTMRTEVTLGQYLDILDERAWRSFDEGELLPRAHRVVVYKSAKYSIEAPLVIGARLGGGDEAQVAALRAVGLPLGIAFQLRDDLLGVFGDPAVTGKPAGDDLREGKRTVLVAIARERLDTAARTALDEALGDEHLDADRVRALQDSLTECGAVSEVERIIDAELDRALAALRDAPIGDRARSELAALADTVVRRSA